MKWNFFFTFFCVGFLWEIGVYEHSFCHLCSRKAAIFFSVSEQLKIWLFSQTNGVQWVKIYHMLSYSRGCKKYDECHIFSSYSSYIHVYIWHSDDVSLHIPLPPLSPLSRKWCFMVLIFRSERQSMIFREKNDPKTLFWRDNLAGKWNTRGVVVKKRPTHRSRKKTTWWARVVFRWKTPGTFLENINVLL